MASFSDYAEKQEDNLQDEIDSADKQTADRKDADNQIPDRFKDKSVEEVVQSYTELEKRFSQQGNTLGEMRKVLDDQILQRNTVEETTTPEASEVSLDDLYEDPDKVVRRVVGEETDARLEAMEKELAHTKVQAAVADLTRKHPSWEQDVRSEEFETWVNSTPIRARMSRIVRETGDPTAADELLTEYYGAKKSTADAARTAQREQALDDASLESSGAQVTHGEQTFSRTELMNIRIAAKQGNREAADWLKANQNAIAYAYEEGHITD